MLRGLSKINFFLTAGLLTLVVSAGFFNFARAQNSSGTYNFIDQSGLNVTSNAAGYDIATPTTVNQLIGNIILTALSLLGVIFLIYLIYGGFTWMTAHGNEEKVGKANKIIFSALIGIIITLAAYGVSYFLLRAFWTGEIG